MVTSVKTIHTPDLSVRRHQVLFDAAVPAGFPSPAADYEQEKLDLNRHLVSNPAATFFVKVAGDSMIGAGIHHGDLLVVDRSLEPRDKSVVIAVLNGELTVKRIRIKGRKVTLEPENDNYTSQEVTADTAFEVWGIVTSVIHRL
jgi:DNA polymerase V